MLLYFLVDYVRDAFIPESSGAQPSRRLREAFARDPGAVCREYGVGRQDLENLGNLSPQVEALMPATVRDYLRAMHPESSLLWPGPSLTVEQITPAQVTAGEQKLELTIGVDPPDFFDGSSFSVEPTFAGSDGEVVVGAVEPISVPPSPVKSLTFTCRAKFDKPGAYHGRVTVTKLDGQSAQPVKVARIELGQLSVR